MASVARTTNLGPQNGIHKRSRVPLSCTFCRVRKLKCDRERPCQNCSIRKDNSRCIYNEPETSSTMPGQPRSDQMQNRLNRLESIVANLMTDTPKPISSENVSSGASPISFTDASQSLNNGNAVSKRDEELADAGKSLGVLRIEDDDRFLYRGSTHWDDVLHELAELKHTWNECKEEMEGHIEGTSWDTSQRPAITPSFSRLPSRAELLASLPSKPATDKLLARFFNVADPVIPALQIIHQPTFMEEYEEHWMNPENTKIMWLGLLYTILCLTMQSYLKTSEEPPDYQGVSQTLADIYHSRATQCLTLADVTRPVPYTIETMLFKGLTEISFQEDTETGLWMMLGTVIRAAMRVGLHRDASHYPNITPFQGEMRRRIWAFVVQADIINSFNIGLPTMIRSVESDTDVPRNIHEAELSKKMLELPSSRPSSEPTAISYMIAKNRILRVIGEIMEVSTSLRSPLYEQVVDLDKRLEAAFEEVPPHLKHDRWDDSRQYPPFHVLQGIHISRIYNQGVIALWRRYLIRKRSPGFAISRQRCIGSSLSLLSHQLTLYRESRLGGRAPRDRWYSIPVSSNDFGLATMVLCLILQEEKEQEHVGVQGTSPIDDGQRRVILNGLKSSYSIWKELRANSKAARRVFRVVSVMLQRLDKSETYGSGATPQTSQYPTPPETTNLNFPGGTPMVVPGPINYSPNDEAYLSLSDNSPLNMSSLFPDYDPNVPYFPIGGSSRTPFEECIGPSGTFAWPTWDQVVQDQVFQNPGVNGMDESL